MTLHCCWSVTFPPGNPQHPEFGSGRSYPSLSTYGSLGRNTLRGPGPFNFDLSLSQSTAITEHTKLELRMDVLNISSSAKFANPDTNFTDSTFGQITTT